MLAKFNNFRSYGASLCAVLLVSKLNKMYFGYFDPENTLIDNDFQGELTDNSA